MENRLDRIELGEMEWKAILREFYPGFIHTVQDVEKSLSKIEVKDEVSEIPCEVCGRMMVYKMGKFGRFLACPGFPECRNTKAIYEKLEGVLCPKCTGEVHIKKSKKGRKYYGCEHNPECDFMLWDEPTGEACPQCSSPLVKSGKNIKCSNNTCQFIANH